MKEYQLYLFDMDGTLVNSEPLKGQAIVSACLEFGMHAEVDTYKEVMGESWQVVAEHFFRKGGHFPDPDQFREQFKRNYQALLQKGVELTPGARDYIESLNAQGIACGLVSSAASWMADDILASLTLSDTFDIVITQEHVTHHKPHPEAYLLALSRLGIAASNTLVFEDSHAGVSAAKLSGCDVIAVRHAFNQNNDLSDALMEITRYPQRVNQYVSNSQSNEQ